MSKKFNPSGLVFDENPIKEFIRSKFQIDDLDDVAYSLAASLEYLTAEIMELSGNAARDFSLNEIEPDHMRLAIVNDDELKAMLSQAAITGIPELPDLLKENSDKNSLRSIVETRINFSESIVIVLKQVHPDKSVSIRAKTVMNSILNDVLTSLLYHSFESIEKRENKIYDVEDVIQSIGKVYYGDLTKHCVCEARKAISRLHRSKELQY